MARHGKRYTIYDAMEEKGLFMANSANIDARDENGASAYQKQHFPRMIYHPKGEMRVVNPAEEVVTPFGPAYRNEKKEIINRIVKSQEEYDSALAAGWHTHPALAIAAGGGEAPEMGLDIQMERQRLAQEQVQAEADSARAEADALRRELEALKAEKELETARQAGHARPK